MKPLSILSAALLVGASVFAQSASYSLAGTACTTGRLNPAVGPVPFSVRGVPRLGSSFTIVTEGTAGYPWGVRRQVFLITGVSNTMSGGVALPFDISTLNPGQPWCGELRTSPEVTTRVPTVRPYTMPAQVTIAVPNVVSLAGTRFYQQVVSIEFSSFGPPFRAVALSQGGQGTIGF